MGSLVTAPLDDLLPADVVVATAADDDPDAVLPPVEAQAVARAVASRRAEFTTGRALLGVPNLAWVALAISVVFWVLLNRSGFGRRVSAIGQNPRAARLAGVPVARTSAATYVISAVMAALAGTPSANAWVFFFTVAEETVTVTG